MIRYGTLRVENFKAIESAEIDLSAPGVWGVLGDNEDAGSAESNGAGKSSLVDAFVFALTGKTVRGASGDSLVRRGSCGGTRVVLDVLEPELTIERTVGTMDNGGNGVTLTSRGKPIGPRNASDVQSEINRALGVDRELLLTVDVITDRSLVLATEESKKKALLEKLLGLDAFGLARDRVNARRKVVTEAIRELDTTITATSARLDERRLHVGTTSQEDIEAARAALETTRKLIADTNAAPPDLGPQRAELAEVTREVARLDLAIREADAAARKAECDLKVTGVCVTCRRAWTGPEAAAWRAGVEKLLADSRAALPTLLEERAAGAEIAGILTSQIQDATDAWADVQASLATLRANERAQRATLDRLMAAPPTVAPVDGLQADLVAARIGRAELADESAYLEYWYQGFSPGGVLSHALDAAMPYLTDDVNRYLRAFADGYAMTWSTQTALKSGKLKEKLSATVVSDSSVEGAEPSNGEDRKLELASLLALRGLRGLSTPDSNVLILDDAGQGIDPSGMEAVVNALGELGKTKCVLFVSWMSHLAPVFGDRVYRVTRRNGVARVVRG